MFFFYNCKFYHSRIEVFQNFLAFLGSGFLVRWLRGNLKQKSFFFVFIGKKVTLIVFSTQFQCLKSLCAIIFCFALHFRFLSLIQTLKTWRQNHSLAGYTKFWHQNSKICMREKKMLASNNFSKADPILHYQVHFFQYQDINIFLSGVFSYAITSW